MSYDALRHFADSYGLIFMGLSFVILVGWTFRGETRASHEQARTMIFENEDSIDG